MTLYKQIVTGMTALFILLLSSVSIIEFEMTRYHLEYRQQSEVTNTMNALSLALTPYLSDKNYTAVESVLKTLLDGNTYSTIKLKFGHNQPPIEHSYHIQPDKAPVWFSHSGLFQPISQKKTLILNKTVLVEIDIISSPNEAYNSLWNALIRIVIVFICIFILGLVFTLLIIRHALRPLHAISMKISQISRGQFHGTDLPKSSTSDLSSVIENLNQMSSKVERVMITQERKADNQ